MKHFFMPAIILLFLAGCTKVIDLKTRNTTPQYVVEGNVTDQAGPYTISLSTNSDLNSVYAFNGVSGAVVTVKDEMGFSEVLAEVSAGVYETNSMAGVEGRTYFLDIVSGSHHFTAQSTMPHRVNLDSLYIRELVNISKTVKAVVPVFTDPPGQGNAYRFNQYINGNLDKSIYYANDDFTDGQVNSFALLQSDPDSSLQVNDRVEVDMQCIDQAVYKYWYSVDQSASGNANSIPSNPVTNISGGALGYFSAHTSQRRAMIVK